MSVPARELRAELRGDLGNKSARYSLSVAAEAGNEAILATINYFTSDEEQNTDEMNYLLSALRGSIYNQGGPAIGELTGSERNRSREAVDMVHTMIMSSPQ